jgi:hypothetical protein
LIKIKAADRRPAGVRELWLNLTTEIAALATMIVSFIMAPLFAWVRSVVLMLF